MGQSGFAYSFDTLEPDAEEHTFARTLKNLLYEAFRRPVYMLVAYAFPRYSTTTSDPGLVAARNLIFPYVYNLGTPAFQRAVVNALPWKKLHELRDMVDIMQRTSLEILEAGKRWLEEGKVQDRIGGGKDIMTCLRTSTRFPAAKSSNSSHETSQGKYGSIRGGQAPRRRVACANLVSLFSICCSAKLNIFLTAR